MEIFNISLLGKWKWRLLLNEECMWTSLVKRLYDEEGILKRQLQSTWWKDLQSIEKCLNFGGNWFSDSVSVKLRTGTAIIFWGDKWCSPWKIQDLFPNLYEQSVKKNVTVAEFGEWRNNRWWWIFNWTDILTGENHLAEALLKEMLMPIYPEKESADVWRWIITNSKQYSIKSAYTFLINQSEKSQLDDDKREIIKKVWRTPIPTKFLVHGWRLLLD